LQPLYQSEIAKYSVDGGINVDATTTTIDAQPRIELRPTHEDLSVVTTDAVVRQWMLAVFEALAKLPNGQAGVRRERTKAEKRIKLGGQNNAFDVTNWS
jgi:hypothetical protein